MDLTLLRTFLDPKDNLIMLRIIDIEIQIMLEGFVMNKTEIKGYRFNCPSMAFLKVSCIDCIAILILDLCNNVPYAF